MTESDNPLLPLPYGLASTTAGALPLSTVFFTKARKAAVPSVAESGYAEHHRPEQAGHFLASQVQQPLAQCLERFKGKVIQNVS
jgi:hypothetical protein